MSQELKELTRPINPEEIQWRVQSKKNGKTTVVPYLNNRVVQSRFDAQFGSLRWQNSFEKWNGKGVKCGISVYDSELQEWITKYDGADETEIESTKGGFSDSQKRAAVQFGLGRDLYEYPLIQLEGEHKYISAEFETLLHKVAVDQINGVKKSYILLKKSNITTSNNKPWLNIGTNQFNKAVRQIQLEGKTIDDLKKDYSISKSVMEDLKKITPSQMDNHLFKKTLKRFRDGEETVFESAENAGYVFTKEQQETIDNEISNIHKNRS